MGRFYISIGSNINPEKNIILILQELLKMSETITISRILQTKAVDVETDNYFLNLCACLDFSQSETVLTQKFKQIEQKLGRDIFASDRGKKDRTADIDILFQYDNYDDHLDIKQLNEPPWVMLPLADLLHHQHIIEDEPKLPDDSVTLTLNTLEIGKAPMRIKL